MFCWYSDIVIKLFKNPGTQVIRFAVDIFAVSYEGNIRPFCTAKFTKKSLTKRVTERKPNLRVDYRHKKIKYFMYLRLYISAYRYTPKILRPHTVKNFVEHWSPKTLIILAYQLLPSNVLRKLSRIYRPSCFLKSVGSRHGCLRYQYTI